MRIFKYFLLLSLVGCDEKELTTKVNKDPSLFFPKIEIIREVKEPCTSNSLTDLIEAECEFSLIFNSSEKQDDLKSWLQTPNLKGEKPIFLAVKTKRIHLLKKLIELGADISPVDRDGIEKEVLAFDLALDLGDEEMVKVFLNESHDFFFRLFKIANERELKWILKFLKEDFLNPDLIRDSNARSTSYPLLWLSKMRLFGPTSEEEYLIGDIAEYLISHGTWIDKADDHDRRGRTPLYFSIRNNNLSVFRALKKSGKVNLEFRDSLGRGALHLASKFNSLKIFDELLKLDFTWDYSDELGLTPILHSIIEGNFEIFKGLNKNLTQDQLNQKDSWGEGVLHKSTFYGRVEMVKFLLERKMNPNPVNRLGQTPMDIAAKGLIDIPTKRKEYKKIVEILKKYGGTYQSVSN